MQTGHEPSTVARRLHVGGTLNSIPRWVRLPLERAREIMARRRLARRELRDRGVGAIAIGLLPFALAWEFSVVIRSTDDD